MRVKRVKGAFKEKDRLNNGYGLLQERMTKKLFAFMCSCVLGHVCLCGGQKLEYISHLYFQYNKPIPITNPTVCVLLYHFQLCFLFVFVWIQGVSLTPGLLFVQTGYLASCSDLLVSIASSTHSSDLTTLPGFYTEAGDLNSGSSLCLNSRRFID